MIFTWVYLWALWWNTQAISLLIYHSIISIFSKLISFPLHPSWNGRISGSIHYQRISGVQIQWHHVRLHPFNYFSPLFLELASLFSSSLLNICFLRILSLECSSQSFFCLLLFSSLLPTCLFLSLSSSPHSLPRHFCLFLFYSFLWIQMIHLSR